MNFTDDEKQRILQCAPESCRKGYVAISMCPMCGSPSWHCSDASKPDQIDITRDLSPCGYCQAVFHRAPEVAQWVLAVLNWRLREAAESVLARET